MPEDLDTTWERVRSELRGEVTDFHFHIWLAPLSAAGMRGDTLYVRAPDHIRTWVEGRHMPLLAAATRRVLGDRANAELVDENWAEEGSPDACELAAGVRDDSGLNPRYSFEQFVIGDGNRLAHAAALTVAEQPGQAWNPLFIHGPPGLGKTHLLHAIGNYVQEYGLGLTVRYVTSEEFTTEFVQAVRNNSTDPFRQRFRSADVLLVDDTQFLAAKAKTCEEFFHTFNALYAAGSQIVLTSDTPPNELHDLEARLTERFASGLVAELEPPDVDVRLTILNTRARFDSLDGVDEETLLEIARHVDGSVRSLESALIRVVAYASVRGERPTPELARELLPRLGGRPASRRCSLDEIQEATAEAFGVSREALIAHDRRPRVALARQVAMYLSRELTQETLPAIGRVFGGRNHSTVLHAHRRVSAGLEGHDEAAERLAELRQRLSLGG